MNQCPSLILGSTSRYRAELLQRLGLRFEVVSPAVDEVPRVGESPADLAQRLALEKARDVADRHPGAIVIGADQAADLDGEPIGKPGSHERATAQLRRMSGRSVVFQTAVAVVRTALPADPAASPESALNGSVQTRLVPVTVRFRTLPAAEIEFYLRREQPYDCAGSAKCETLGIALLEAIVSDDPTALVGLPLIAVSQMLRAAGLDALANPDLVNPA